MPPTPNDAGQLVDLTPSAPADAVIGQINTQRTKLIEIEAQVAAGKRTEAERQEQIDRMMAGVREDLAAWRKSERQEWAPSGDVALLDAKYLRPDGSVRFFDEKETVKFLDIDLRDVTRPGLLTDTEPCTREQADLIRSFRAFALATVMQKRGWEGAAELRRIHAGNFRTALTRLSGKVGAFCRSFVEDPVVHQRVLNNVAGQGSELISNPTLPLIRRPLTLQRRVVSLIRAQAVSTPTFKQPIITGRGLMRKRGATTDDPARYPVQRFTTSDASISVQDLNINVLMDPNWIRDAAMVLADPMAEIDNWISQADADTMEASFLHGDSTATHEDTISTWTLDSYFSAGQLDGSDSPLRLWKGFRRHAVDDSTMASGGASFTAATHYTAVASMKNHGGMAIMITGLSCFYNSLLANSLFTSFNAIGDRNTLTTGELGNVGKNRLVISEFMPKEFDTSSGLYTGSNKGHEIVYVDPAAYAWYELTDAESGWDVTYPERGARYIGMQKRGVLVKNVPSGEKPAAAIYNT